MILSERGCKPVWFYFCRRYVYVVFCFLGFFFGGIEKVWKELPQNINRYLGIVEFQMTFLLLLILSTINLHVLVIVKGQAAKRSTILRLKEMNFSLI